jgi:hypothetical protein
MRLIGRQCWNGRETSPSFSAGQAYLCPQPSKKSVQRLIGEIREATDRKTAWQEAEAKVKQINRKTFTPKQTTSIKKTASSIGVTVKECE